MVTIYSTPTCGFCHMLKAYLSSKNIEYTDKDISMDVEGQKWVLEHTGQLAVPVSYIGGKIIVGFNRPAIDEAIANLK